MKPTRREASIFNVSAIDLFASALGAFVVVAFVLLPYFPNTGDATATPATVATPADPPRPTDLSTAEVEALRARAERAEAELDAAHARERELGRALDAARSSMQALPPIDLIIALDTTGSMTGEVASLREEIAGLSELLAELTEDAAVGIVDFKDGCGGPPALRIAPLQRVTPGSLQRLAAFARSMRARSPACNVTPDEDYAEALRAAVNADWRPDSEHRSIVLISDNPAHAHLREQAVADARHFSRGPGARHTVSAVLVDTSAFAPNYPDTAAFMQRVAQAGGGQFVRADENASLSVTILRAVFDD